MQTYTKEGRFGITAQQIREENPNTSFPQYLQLEDIDPLGYSIVVDEKPSFDDVLQYLVEDDPAEVEGVWKKTYTVVDYTQEQLDAFAQEKADIEQRLMVQRKSELMTEVINLTQSRLDIFARTRNYDNMMSACTYATSSVPKFKAEAQYCVDARDSTWNTLYSIMSDVENNIRPIPASFTEIESELPVLSWPVGV